MIHWGVVVEGVHCSQTKAVAPFFVLQSQCAFFDFCAGKRHQIVARVRVKAVKVTPKL